MLVLCVSFPMSGELLERSQGLESLAMRVEFCAASIQGRSSIVLFLTEDGALSSEVPAKFWVTQELCQFIEFWGGWTIAFIRREQFGPEMCKKAEVSYTIHLNPTGTR